MGQQNLLKILSLVTKDSLTFAGQALKKLVVDKFPKLADTPRTNLLWLLHELIALNHHDSDGLVVLVLRNVSGGNTTPRNIALCQAMLTILSQAKTWLYTKPVIIPVVLYTYLRLLSDHLKNGLSALREQETAFCLDLFRARPQECLVIGRDLFRQLQYLATTAKLPEFEQLWRDLATRPTSFAPGFTDVSLLLRTPTPKHVLQSRLSIDMETQVLYILREVRFGNQKRYQQWFVTRHLPLVDSESLIPDLVRYICCFYHPPNHVLCSDIVPRWAIIGWLLKHCKSEHWRYSAKLALFYDWLHYDAKLDSIMNIEPAMLLMACSIKKYSDMTVDLIEFIIQVLLKDHDPQRNALYKSGINSALSDILAKGVVPSLVPIFEVEYLGPVLFDKVKHHFQHFLTTSPPPHGHQQQQQQQHGLGSSQQGVQQAPQPPINKERPLTSSTNTTPSHSSPSMQPQQPHPSAAKPPAAPAEPVTAPAKQLDPVVVAKQPEPVVAKPEPIMVLKSEPTIAKPEPVAIPKPEPTVAPKTEPVVESSPSVTPPIQTPPAPTPTPSPQVSESKPAPVDTPVINSNNKREREIPVAPIKLTPEVVPIVPAKEEPKKVDPPARQPSNTSTPPTKLQKTEDLPKALLLEELDQVMTDTTPVKDIDESLINSGEFKDIIPDVLLQLAPRTFYNPLNVAITMPVLLGRYENLPTQPADLTKSFVAWIRTIIRPTLERPPVTYTLFTGFNMTHHLFRMALESQTSDALFHLLIDLCKAEMFLSPHFLIYLLAHARGGLIANENSYTFPDIDPPSDTPLDQLPAVPVETDEIYKIELLLDSVATENKETSGVLMPYLRVISAIASTSDTTRPIDRIITDCQYIQAYNAFAYIAPLLYRFLPSHVVGSTAMLSLVFDAFPPRKLNKLRRLLTRGKLRMFGTNAASMLEQSLSLESFEQTMTWQLFLAEASKHQDMITNVFSSVIMQNLNPFGHSEAFDHLTIGLELVPVSSSLISSLLAMPVHSQCFVSDVLSNWITRQASATISAISSVINSDTLDAIQIERILYHFNHHIKCSGQPDDSLALSPELVGASWNYNRSLSPFDEIELCIKFDITDVFDYSIKVNSNSLYEQQFNSQKECNAVSAFAFKTYVAGVNPQFEITFANGDSTYATTITKNGLLADPVTTILKGPPSIDLSSFKSSLGQPMQTTIPKPGTTTHEKMIMCTKSITFSLANSVDPYAWYRDPSSEQQAMLISGDPTTNGTFLITFNPIAVTPNPSITNLFSQETPRLGDAQCAFASPPPTMFDPSTEKVTVTVIPNSPCLAVTFTSPILYPLLPQHLMYDYVGNTEQKPDFIFNPDITVLGQTGYSYRAVIPKPTHSTSSICIFFVMYPNSLCADLPYVADTVPFAMSSTVLKVIPTAIPTFFATFVDPSDALLIDHVRFSWDTGRTGSNNYVIDRNISSNYATYFTIPYDIARPLTFNLNATAVTKAGDFKLIKIYSHTFVTDVIYNKNIAVNQTQDPIANYPNGFALGIAVESVPKPSDLLPFMLKPFTVRPMIWIKDQNTPIAPTIPESFSEDTFPWGFSGALYHPSMYHVVNVLPYAPMMRYTSRTGADFEINIANYSDSAPVDLVNPLVQVKIEPSTTQGDFILRASVRDATGIRPNECSVTVGHTRMFLNPEYLIRGDYKSGEYLVPFRYNHKAFCHRQVKINCQDINYNQLQIDSKNLGLESIKQTPMFTLPECQDTSITKSKLVFVTFNKISDTSFNVTAVVSGPIATNGITTQKLSVFRDYHNTKPFGLPITGTSTVDNGNVIMNFVVNFGTSTSIITYYLGLAYGNDEDSITLSTQDIELLLFSKPMYPSAIRTDEPEIYTSITVPATGYKPIYDPSLIVELDGNNIKVSSNQICSYSSITVSYMSHFVPITFTYVVSGPCDSIPRVVGQLTATQKGLTSMLYITEICIKDSACQGFPMFGFKKYNSIDINEYLTTVNGMSDIPVDFNATIDVSANVDARKLSFNLSVNSMEMPMLDQPMLFSMVDTISGHRISATTKLLEVSGLLCSYSIDLDIPLNWGATPLLRPKESYAYYYNFLSANGIYTNYKLYNQLNITTYSSALRDNTPYIWSTPTINLADRTITIIGSNLGISTTYSVQGKVIPPPIIINPTTMIVSLKSLDISYDKPIDMTIGLVKYNLLTPEPKCISPDCSGHGTCNNSICVCLPEWTGDSCSISASFPCDCNDHGSCSSMLCNCDSGWSGPTCQVELAKTNTGMEMKPNQTAPVVVFNGVVLPDVNGQPAPLTELSHQTSFSIHIESIRELDFDNKLVATHNPQWRQIVTNEISATYRHDFSDDKTSFVTVRVDMYKDGGSTQWANDTIKFAPSTTKYTVSLTNYNFSSSLNHLVVVFESSSTAPCASYNESDISWGAASLDDMHWFVIPQHQLSLYGRFTNKVIVDGRVTKTANLVLNKAEPILIAVNVPYFSQSAEVDPDFSVLVDLDRVDKDSCTDESTIRKAYIIPVAVVAAVIGATILVVIGVLVFKKTMFFRTRMHKMRMHKSSQSLSRMDNL
eukprot:gene16694-19845_t